MKKLLFTTAVGALALTACKKSDNTKTSTSIETVDTDYDTYTETDSEGHTTEIETTSTEYDTYNDIEDGVHSAEVRIYNPNTGHTGTYTLDVEVENGELVKIYWDNGGWLDESHFTATDISNGTASFTDDEGREYEVTIN